MENKIKLLKTDVQKINNLIFSKKDKSDFYFYLCKKDLYVISNYTIKEIENSVIVLNLKVINDLTIDKNYYFSISKEGFNKFKSEVIIDFKLQTISNDGLKLMFGFMDKNTIDNNITPNLKDYLKQTPVETMIRKAKMVLKFETVLDIINKTKLITFNKENNYKKLNHVFFYLHNFNIKVGYTNSYSFIHYKISNQLFSPSGKISVDINILKLLKKLKINKNDFITFTQKLSDANIYKIRFNDYLMILPVCERKVPFKIILDEIKEGEKFQINITKDILSKLKNFQELIGKENYKKGIKCTVGNNKLKLIPMDLEEITPITIDIKTNNENHSVFGINIKFLTDFLSNIDYKNLVFHINEVTQPLWAIPKDKTLDNFIFVSMQIKLDE